MRSQGQIVSHFLFDSSSFKTKHMFLFYSVFNIFVNTRYSAEACVVVVVAGIVIESVGVSVSWCRCLRVCVTCCTVAAGPS